MTTPPTTARDEHLAQAKLFAEVARRAERSLDAFEGGDLSRVLLVLWQQAAGYALLAAEAADAHSGDAPQHCERRLERAAGGAEPLKAVLDLLPTSVPGQPDTALIAARVEQIASFTRRLIAELEDAASSARRRLLVRLRLRQRPRQLCQRPVRER